MTDRWDVEYVRREGERLFVTVRSNTTLEFRWESYSGLSPHGIVPPG